MSCTKCGGNVVARKELSNTTTRRKVLQQCLKCKQYYIRTETKPTIVPTNAEYCQKCKTDMPYKLHTTLTNWIAYERGEEPEEISWKECTICGTTID